VPVCRFSFLSCEPGVVLFFEFIDLGFKLFDVSLVEAEHLLNFKI
jgi:hypothetical protein